MEFAARNAKAEAPTVATEVVVIPGRVSLRQVEAFAQMMGSTQILQTEDPTGVMNFCRAARRDSRLAVTMTADWAWLKLA